MDHSVRIRFMKVEDLDQVQEVEASCFQKPWTREAFFNEVTKNQFAYYLVAEEGDSVVAYCGVWIIMDDAHITNIAVHPDMRRRGIGEDLLRGVMDMAKTLGAQKMSLEVRVSNDNAKALYRKYGFQDGGIRKQYYTDNQEDALVMWVRL
ncbi:ribosomal protein S18-alanine N-acetyltransferase [Salisediminibacterium halotolerans]|uniref:[Ribosomal protein bS18]-alanine N-acetyltransferase n=1 Tax=Salisediminibacterium halotolerans TaxID=517425 RepID=A0A1H9TCL0_9BACI|nr:ribosomal protein S18-alanine N-acetyltransferase [Salisediminibacterium haloalkalitolerans]SER94848.1 ribosomal-protein-alanine N-acetyltransferase [Salisediminibacterium haloalkalitolerans]